MSEALCPADGQYQSAIVLAYLPEDELRLLAEALPEVDAVLGGPTGQPIAPKQLGPTLLASATSKGKFVVELDAPPVHSIDHWTGRIVELGERFADDPRQMANVRQFRRDLAAWDFREADGFCRAVARRAAQGIRGRRDRECRKCHTADGEAWQESKHAGAWKALVATGAHVDPECQRCHTTGYGLPGGFASARRSTALVEVGCESCHGPSQGHAADPTVHTLHFRQAGNQCRGCHDRENSPKFVYDEYWRRSNTGRE